MSDDDDEARRKDEDDPRDLRRVAARLPLQAVIKHLDQTAIMRP